MQEREKEHQLNTKRLREQQIYTQVDHLMHAPFLFHTIFHLDQVYWRQHTEHVQTKQAGGESAASEHHAEKGLPFGQFGTPACLHDFPLTDLHFAPLMA